MRVNNNTSLIIISYISVLGFGSGKKVSILPANSQDVFGPNIGTEKENSEYYEPLPEQVTYYEGPDNILQNKWQILEHKSSTFFVDEIAINAYSIPE